MRERAEAAGVTAGAAELADRIARGELSAVDAVGAHLARIEAVNGRLNAVVVPLFARALADAATADERRRRGEPLGPLHGVPVTVKESFDVAGTATTAGLAGRAASRAASDAAAVRALRRAGAIVLGKTNLSQLLLYNESDNPVHGRTLNPWSAERAPGGSSGGEAAIVAAGGSALGLGSDIGGSVREPAHACGVHGLKPTTGRLSLAGEADEWLFGPIADLLAQPGPIARTVPDLALALRVLAEPEPGASSAAAPPLGDPGAVSLRGLRVAAYVDDGFFPAAPALRRATREAADALRARGAELVELAPPHVPEAMRIFFGILSGDGGDALAAVAAGSRLDRRISGLLRICSLPAALRPLLAGAAAALGQRRIAETVRSVRRVAADRRAALLEERARYRARLLAALDAARVGALICPPHALPALRHGASELLSSAASYAMLFNLVGLPAGVVAATRVRPGEESDRPARRDVVERAAARVEAGSAGLPVGVQVAARPWREDVVLAVMGALEEHFRARPDYPALLPG